MQISLRSQLIAGTAAVVGASAIAMTPVTGAPLSLSSVQAPSAVQTALVAFSSPLAQLSNTLIQANAYLFNTDLSPVDTTQEFFWPYSGIELGNFPVGEALWPLLLANPEGAAPELGGYSSVGLIPQIIDDALPVISQLGYNGSDYLNATLGSLGVAGAALGTGIVNSIEQLLAFNIPGSIEALLAGINTAGSQLLFAGGYVLTGVVNRLTAVAEATFGLLPILLGTTLRQLEVVAGSVAAVATNFFDAFGAEKPIESAWNALVNGLLGPSGIPGTLLNLTIGAGVQTGPIVGLSLEQLEASIQSEFVPSIRGEIQGAVKVVAAALATPVVPPTASVAAPAAADVAEAPAAVEVAEVAAPAAVEVTEVKPPAVVEAPAAVEAPAGDVEAPAAKVSARQAPAAVTAPAASASDDGGAVKNTPKRASRGAKKASSSAE